MDQFGRPRIAALTTSSTEICNVLITIGRGSFEGSTPDQFGRPRQDQLRRPLTIRRAQLFYDMRQFQQAEIDLANAEPSTDAHWWLVGASTAAERGQDERATGLAERGFQLATLAKDLDASSYCRLIKADLAVRAANCDEAEIQISSCEESFRATANVHGLLATAHRRGRIAVERADFPEALKQYEIALSGFAANDDVPARWTVLCELNETLLQLGHLDAVRENLKAHGKGGAAGLPGLEPLSQLQRIECDIAQGYISENPQSLEDQLPSALLGIDGLRVACLYAELNQPLHSRRWLDRVHPAPSGTNALFAAVLNAWCIGSTEPLDDILRHVTQVQRLLTKVELLGLGVWVASLGSDTALLGRWAEAMELTAERLPLLPTSRALRFRERARDHRQIIR